MLLKNQQFQQTAVKCKDGSMLHLRSRQEVDVSKLELDEDHLQSMLNEGYVALRGKRGTSDKPLETSEAPKPDKVEVGGSADPAHNETERQKSTSKRK